MTQSSILMSIKCYLFCDIHLRRYLLLMSTNKAFFTIQSAENLLEAAEKNYATETRNLIFRKFHCTWLWIKSHKTILHEVLTVLLSINLDRMHCGTLHGILFHYEIYIFFTKTIEEIIIFVISFTRLLILTASLSRCG